MSDTWQKAYLELKDYISKNPGIEIEPDCVRIPSNTRPEFYRLFNTVNVNFIKDKIAALLEKAYVLSKMWGEANRDVRDNLGLETIDTDVTTRWFLTDPIDGLTRELFGPLFDLVKGSKDLATFEQTSVLVLEDKFTKFFQEGYQCWAITSLLKLLLPDMVFQVPPDDWDLNTALHQEEYQGTREEMVPDAVETKSISLVHNIKYSFLTPNLIAHSTRLGLFTAFGRDFAYSQVQWRACSLGQEQQRFAISDIVGEFGRKNLWPDLALYTGSLTKELVVIADYWQMARPDIIIEFREKPDWYAREGLESVKRHYNVLKPKLGSFVVCLEPVPEAALKEIEPKTEDHPGATDANPVIAAQLTPDIHLLSVGYDITKLDVIVEKLRAKVTAADDTAT